MEKQPMTVVQDAKEAEARIEIVNPFDFIEPENEIYSPSDNIDPLLREMTQGYTDF